MASHEGGEGEVRGLLRVRFLDFELDVGSRILRVNDQALYYFDGWTSLMDGGHLDVKLGTPCNAGYLLDIIGYT